MTSAPYRPFGTFRLILALAVAVDHGGWLAGGTLSHLIAASRMGSAAVLGFFVLSGFILAEAATTFYAGRWLPMAANRILKIVPAFLGALALSLAVRWIVTRLGLLQRGTAFENIKPTAQTVWASRNLLYNPFSIVPFMRPDEMWHYVGQIYLFVRYVWAINVEMTFYMLLAVYIALRPGAWRAWATTGIVSIIVGVMFFRSGLLTSASFVYYVFFSPFFCFGIALYAAQRTRHFLAVGATLVFAALSILNGFRFIGTVGGDVIFVMMLAALFFLSCTKSIAISRAADRRFGDLSYAVYLNQYAVFVALSAAAPPSGVAMLLAGILVVVAISAALQIIIERPLSPVRAAVRGTRLGDQSNA